MTTEVLPPLSEHQLLLLFAELFLLLFTARGLGELVTRVGFPSVLGELLAGIVIGPSLLGAIAPEVFAMIFPPEPSQYHLLEAVSWIGLLMLLIVTGLETDLELIINRARSATYTAIGGIIIPFVMGVGLGYLLPSEFLVDESQRFVFSLFIGTALSISAIPVIAKVLIDMGMIHRDVGQITIAAGMLNDTIGWILLALVASLARAGGTEALSTTGMTLIWLVIILGVSFTIGPRFVDWLLRWIGATVGSDDLTKTTVVMILALGFGTITHYLGLEAVLGAFVVGVLVGQVRQFDSSARHTFEVITIGIFAPIFFATAGLRVDLTTLVAPPVLVAGSAVLGVAIAGKFIGSYLGAKAAGLSNWEGIAMGSGLNARGALELIVATIGLSIGVLTTTTYTIIVTVAIVTSLLAPPLLRLSLTRIELSADEVDRIERKELARKSFLGDVIRVLLPTRCSIDSQLAARLTGHIARQRDITVTNMYVDTTGTEPSGTPLIRRAKRVIDNFGTQDRMQRDGGTAETERPENCLDIIGAQLDLPGKQVRNVVRTADTTVSETVLEAVSDDYDLLALGASGWHAPSNGPFSRAIDDLIRSTSCPLLLVCSNMDSTASPLPSLAIQRILLPTIGTQYSRRAAEIAFTLALAYDATVEITHVVNRSQIEDTYMGMSDQSVAEAISLGEAIVDREAELGQTMGADVRTIVSVGNKPERTLIERATIDEMDLIVLGSEIRPSSRRAFFGHRVEYVVDNAPCPVVIVSSS